MCGHSLNFLPTFLKHCREVKVSLGRSLRNRCYSGSYFHHLGHKFETTKDVCKLITHKISRSLGHEFSHYTTEVDEKRHQRVYKVYVPITLDLYCSPFSAGHSFVIHPVYRKYEKRNKTTHVCQSKALKILELLLKAVVRIGNGSPHANHLEGLLPIEWRNAHDVRYCNCHAAWHSG
jgi:hypothetical protein